MNVTFDFYFNYMLHWDVSIVEHLYITGKILPDMYLCMLKYKWFWIFKGANNVKCTFQEGEWEWKIAGIRLVYTTSKHTKYIFIDWNVITFWNWILFSLLLLLSKSEFWIAENRTRVEAKMWNFFFIVQRYSLFYDLNLIFACVHLTRIIRICMNQHPTEK